MVMDPSFQRYSDAVNGLSFSTASVPNQNIANGFKLEETYLLDEDHNYIAFPLVPPDWNQTNDAQASSESIGDDTPENECPDFSDTVLKYISQMLMEEDMEEKSCMIQESCVILQAAEKPFYEILGKKYPPSPNHHPLDHNIESWLDYSTSSSSSSSSSSNPLDSNVFSDLGAQFQNVPIDYTLQSTPQSSLNPSNGVNYVVDGIIDSPPLSNTINVPDMYSDEHDPQWHFRKGVEEASKFLPSGTNLFVSLESNGSVRKGSIRDRNSMVVKKEKKDDKEDSPNGSRGKKNLQRMDIDLEEGRSNKHSAVFADEPLRSEIFDRILLCRDDKRSIDEHVANLQETLKTLKTEAGKNEEQNGQSKPSNGGKSRGKKQGGKKDVVDLRTLLNHCAQAVAGDDRRSATELLKQIRQHSSPYGDGNQRLAYYFANGLEARLAGTGSQIHTSLLTKRTSAADILKAYQLYLAACPFKKISNFFANQSIMDLTKNATTLHIVDFGISYGFQWPCLIQRLSARPGGPPKLRITGIDLPQPGFRPAERVEETGRRLANYAQSFNVPFEFNAIAQKWETIQVEDIKIEAGENLVVNCLYRFKSLLDETVVLDSPRNTVLKLIRKMNPTVFIQGVVNGSYNAPFFTTRFREALFHYSSIFDMLETNVPREHPERLVLERDLFGSEALNVIACEGTERMERPETYKQWQVRNTRAGFQQLPLQQECMEKAKDRVKSSYHKDFVIDRDGQWMLHGWKGRILFGISCWRPVHDS